MLRIFAILSCVVAMGCLSHAQERRTHAAAGEFAVAHQAALGSPITQRDQILGQVASQQSYAGEPVAAARTIRDIQSSGQRDSVIREVGGAGGGGFADFGSLMQLIETTVVPDTWEALGGPSTMAPYPQGVYVDPNGTLQSCQALVPSEALDDLNTLLRSDRNATSGSNTSWRQPSPMRVVSLRRLKDEIGQLRMLGQSSSESIMHLCGLSRIQYVILRDDDVLLAGPVGGIEKVDGWFRDQQTGRNTLRSDFLFTCLAAARNNRPFGCTIDPTPQGLKQAALVAQAVQNNSIPVGKAAEKM